MIRVKNFNFFHIPTIECIQSDKTINNNKKDIEHGGKRKIKKFKLLRSPHPAHDRRSYKWEVVVNWIGDNSFCCLKKKINKNKKLKEITINLVVGYKFYFQWKGGGSTPWVYLFPSQNHFPIIEYHSDHQTNDLIADRVSKQKANPAPSLYPATMIPNTKVIYDCMPCATCLQYCFALPKLHWHSRLGIFFLFTYFGSIEPRIQRNSTKPASTYNQMTFQLVFYRTKNQKYQENKNIKNSVEIC